MVAYPWIAYAMAGAFALLWAGYAIYESLMKARVLCSGECNIRVDLLVIYPALVAGLVAAVVSLLRAPSAGRTGAPPGER